MDPIRLAKHGTKC
jgi:hypothetical protein